MSTPEEAAALDREGAPDARVLGRMLSSVVMLAAMPDEERLARFLEAALRELPGVETCALLLSAKTDTDPSHSGSAHPGYEAFELDVDAERQGRLELCITDERCFAPYRPFVSDLALSLAMLLQDRRRREVAVASLQASEAVYRAVIDSMVEGVCIQSADGEVRSVNKTAELIAGYACGQIVDGPPGSKCRETIREDGSPFPHDCWPATISLRDGRSQRDVIVGFRGADGDVVWTSVNSAPLVNSGEIKPYGVVTTLRDITDHRRIDEALRLTQFSVDKAVDLIHWIDREGHIVYASDAMCRRHGWTREELLGMTIFEVDPAVTPERLQELCEQTRKHGSLTLESVHRTKDGECFPVELVSHWVESGGREYYFVFARDVSERKQAEATLRESELRYREVFENISDCVFTLDVTPDRRFRLREQNPASENSIGVWTSEVSGRCIEEVVPSDLAAHLTTHYRLCLEAGAPLGYEEEIVVPAGRRSFRTVLVPIRDADGEICRIIGMAQDTTEGRWTEAALRRSRDQLEAAMDLANLVDWEFDVQSRTFTLNDRFYALYGTTAEFEGGYQMPADEYLQRFIHPEDQHVFTAEAEKAIGTIDSGYRAFLEHRAIRRDGEVRHMAVRYTVVKDREGKTVKTHGANQDITERKRMDEALRESEERFRAIYEQGSIGIEVIDRDGRIVRANPAFCDMLGCEESELTGLRSAEITAPEDAERTDRAMRALVEGEQQVFRMDKRYRRKDGGLVWGHISAVALRGKDGRPVGTVAMVQDITERKRAEESLRLTQLSVDSSAELIHWIGPDGHLLYVSDAACQRHGFSREEMLEMTIFDLDPSMTPDRWREHWRDLRQFGSLTLESSHRAKDGEVFPVEITATWVECGGQEYNFAFARDISERKRAEAALEQSQTQLHQAQKMEAVGQLAGGIAHDFNNLLTVIIGSASLLLDDMPASDPRLPLIAGIKDTGDRAAALTRQILAFSRRQTLRPRVLSLNDVITNIRPLLARTLGEDVEVALCLADDLDAVEVDPTRMEQVILNLALNARDAMPNGGRLVIETSNVVLGADYVRTHPWVEPGAYVAVTVSDTGCGMSEETMARIFEPFFTTKEVGKGTGLGLSTVYGIVKQSRGSISVYSELDLGTTFRIFLPAAGRAQSPHEEPRPRTSDMRGGSETILLVEDEGAVRQLLEGVLAAVGYSVHAGGSWEEALAILQNPSVKPDLLVTDLVLPGGVGGWTVAERLLERYPALPVLFISGYTQHAVVQAGRLDGSAELLEKPFEPNVLVAKVREMLDGVPRAD